MGEPRVPRRASITELETIANLSHVSIRKHIRKAGLQKDGKGRYDTEDVLSAILSHRQADNANGGDHTLTRVRMTKAALECQKLQHELALMRKQVMLVADHHAEISTIALVVNAGLKEFPQWVTVEFRNPLLTRKAKQIVERLKAWLLAQINGREAPATTKKTTKAKGRKKKTTKAGKVASARNTSRRARHSQ